MSLVEMLQTVCNEQGCLCGVCGNRYPPNRISTTILAPPEEQEKTWTPWAGKNGSLLVCIPCDNDRKDHDAYVHGIGGPRPR